MAARNVEISRIAPSTAFKTAIILGLIGLVVWLIAVSIVYVGVDSAGYVDQLNSLIGGVGGDQGVGFGLVISAAGLVGIIGLGAFAVLAPIVAVIYNIIAGMLGGVRVTLSDVARR